MNQSTGSTALPGQVHIFYGMNVFINFLYEKKVHMISIKKSNGIPVTEKPLIKYKDEEKLAKKRFPFTLRNEFVTKEKQENQTFFNWCETRRIAALSGLQEWDKYDPLIRKLMYEMNSHLWRTTPHYMAIDWRWIKAMAWTETGAGDRQWNSNTMQIGVSSDPGILVVTDRDNEMTKLITPPINSWQNLKKEKIKTIPEINFRAAIIYLMSRLSTSEIRSVKKPYLAPSSVTISRKKELSTLNDIIMKKYTTEETLREMNNIPRYLHDGDVLKYVPAEKKRVITGWNLPINAQRIALAYNGGGDSQYIEKIKYSYSIIIRKAS